MIKIGITGVIGSGKTTLSNIISGLGITVIDADAISREVVKSSGPAYDKVVKVFGRDVLDKSGEIDRKKLAKIVFSDVQQRKKLEGIIHPEVQKKREEIINSIKSSSEIVVLDIPLLFEAGLENTVDYTVLAYADSNTCFDRVSSRDNMSLEEFNSRISNQIPIDEKVRKADFVIDTRKDISLLKIEVENLIAKIKSTKT